MLELAKDFPHPRPPIEPPNMQETMRIQEEMERLSDLQDRESSRDVVAKDLKD
jgi:hypothetical protein